MSLPKSVCGTRQVDHETAAMEAKPCIVKRELCSPRGVTLRYVLRGVSASPGGTESVIEVSYKHTSLNALREMELMSRKKMTAICARNNASYKRAMAHFNPRERARQLERGRVQKQQQRHRQKMQLRAASGCRGCYSQHVSDRSACGGAAPERRVLWGAPGCA